MPDDAALLDDRGYLVLPQLLPAEVADRLRRRLEEVVERRWAELADDPEALAASWPESGVVREQLMVDDDDLALLADHPRVRSLAVAVLGGPVVAGKLSLRAPMPGNGHQGLHPDAGLDEPRGTGARSSWPWVSVMWCISEFRSENGPLRVIPGSHRNVEPPIDVNRWGSGMGPHPDEVKIAAPAGSAILFNSAEMWHSGTFNFAPEPRLAVSGSFKRALP